jgi:hypothetical protein
MLQLQTPFFSAVHVYRTLDDQTMNTLFGFNIRSHYRSTSTAHHSSETSSGSAGQDTCCSVDIEVCCQSAGNERRSRRCQLMTLTGVSLLVVSLLGGVVVTLIGYGPLRHWLEKSRDGDSVEQMREASDFRKSSLIVCAQVSTAFHRVELRSLYTSLHLRSP